MSDQSLRLHEVVSTYARENGLAPSPDQVAVAAQILESNVTVYAGGLTLAALSDGRSGTILDALAETTRWFPKAAPAPKAKAQPRRSEPKPASPAPRPAHGAHVPGRTDAMAQLAAGLDHAAEADADALARQIAAGPNPWVAGRHHNRTKQAILTNRHPDLAARLRAEAGAI